MDALGIGPLTAACGTAAEARAARRAGLPAHVVGLAAVSGAPDGALVSFGLAGALDGIPAGTVVDATRIVDETGRTLWQGPGLGVRGARTGTLVTARQVVDEPAARSDLFRRTGAEAVDLESGVLAATGRLRGALRVIGDTSERPLGALSAAVDERGRVAWRGLARALSRDPRGALRAIADARRALAVLSLAAKELRA